MGELLERMAHLRSGRQTQRMILAKNTIAMRLIVVEAQAAGLGTRQIAKLLGITTRTVYYWLKG